MIDVPAFRPREVPALRVQDALRVHSILGGEIELLPGDLLVWRRRHLLRDAWDVWRMRSGESDLVVSDVVLSDAQFQALLAARV